MVLVPMVLEPVNVTLNYYHHEMDDVVNILETFQSYNIFQRYNLQRVSSLCIYFNSDGRETISQIFLHDMQKF